MAGRIKGWRWPACHSPPLSALPVLSQSSTQNSNEKYFSVIDWACLARLKQPNPTQLAPSTGSSKCAQVFGRISALIWPRSASDWGVLAVCARLPPKSLEVHKILLCSFGHSTFTPITFYMIQRNLIQPCFKGRFLAFYYVYKKMRIFKAHLSSTYDRALMLLWCVELARPEWLCPTCWRRVRAGCGRRSVDVFSKLVTQTSTIMLQSPSSLLNCNVFPTVSLQLALISSIWIQVHLMTETRPEADAKGQRS